MICMQYTYYSIYCFASGWLGSSTIRRDSAKSIPPPFCKIGLLNKSEAAGYVCPCLLLDRHLSLSPSMSIWLPASDILFAAIAIGLVFNSPHSTFGRAIFPPAFSMDSKCACLLFTSSIATDRPFTSLEILCSDARAATTICCTSIPPSWQGMALISRSSIKDFTTSAGIPISIKSSRVKDLLRLSRHFQSQPNSAFQNK